MPVLSFEEHGAFAGAAYLSRLRRDVGRAVTEILAPFWRWLERFPPRALTDIRLGTDRVALLIDDRDDDVVRRVYANAVAVLGFEWSHRYVAVRGDNALLASRAFWEAIPERYVLIYQRDTVLFRPVPEETLAWAMIGAPCGSVETEHWTLNGGLSMRRRQDMLDAIGVIDRPDGLPEDVYFTAVLREMGRPLPDRVTAGRFAVESAPDYSALPVGVHGTDKPYLSLETAEAIVREAMAA